MRVGVSLLTLFPGRVGGSETYVRGLLEQFACGHGPEQVTVLANRHVLSAYGHLARGPVVLRGVSSYRPGNRLPTRALAMATAWALPRRIARDVPRDFEVMHFAVTVPIPSTSLPSVVTIHDVQHLDLPELFSRPERRYRYWAYDGAARAADRVVTGSDYSKERLVERAGVDPEKVHVIPYGIDLDGFAAAGSDGDEALLSDVKLPERFIVYPANLWPHKNHGLLIDALAAVRDPEIALVLTGQGYGRLDALLERARKVGVAGRVRHVGFLPRAALPALYRRAQAMVFPSLYEGFGAPPLEAMAAGLPVASSGQGSLREICAGATLDFDPTEPDSIATAIDRIVSDKPLRERLRAAGRERASGFSWAATAERHRDVYSQAVEVHESS